MLDEIRSHEPHPNAEERRWMSTNPRTAAVRIAVFVVVSIAVGTSTSLWIERSSSVPHVARTGK